MLDIAKFKDTVHSAAWYKPGVKILVACSGGIDSTVLLHLLAQVPEVELSIIHYDHQLRDAESDADRIFVERMGAHLGYGVYTISEDIEEYANLHKLSLEEAGSIKRRICFKNQMNSINYDFVATGLHADDQIETILMNLYHGSGIKGLTGTGKWSDAQIRPLLPFTRSEILEYAETHQLEYRVDTSNSDISFFRNNIRLNLVPVLSNQNHDQLKTLVEDIIQEGQALNSLIERSIEDADIEELRPNYAVKIGLGLGGLPDYFSPIQKAIFDRAFQSISSVPQGVSTKHFDALRTLFSEDSLGNEIQLPHSVSVCRDRKGVVFYKKSQLLWSAMSILNVDTRIFPFFKIDITSASVQKYIQDPSYFWPTQNYESLEIRPHRAGDRLIIDARGTSLTVNQILQAGKVAPHIKEHYPVLVHDNKVLWIPGVRTAFTELLPQKAYQEEIEKHCIKIQFQEGTFE